MNNSITSKIIKTSEPSGKKVMLNTNAIQKASCCFPNIVTCFFLILAFLSVLSSCKLFSHKKTSTPQQVIVFPAPPDTARFQYLTKITTSMDLGAGKNFFREFILGSEKPSIMTKPYGIAIHNGKIYVCDMYGGPMEIIDLEKKKMNFFNPRGLGRLISPVNCFMDEKGYLYVADPGRVQIVVYDQNLKYVKSIGEKEKFKPSDVFVYHDKIYVANVGAGNILVYNTDSINKLLYSFPNADSPVSAHLGLPANITVGKDTLYAADFGYAMIKRYKIDGTYIDSIGSRGSYPGQFAKLKGIAVDKESNMYAVDTEFENVQMFNSKGQLLMPLAYHYNDGPGGLVLPAKVIVDYDNLKYFQKYVDPRFDLKFLVFVTSQYGPSLINVYGRVEPKGQGTK